MSKRKRKRLFPKQYSASYVKTTRIDHNKAAAYNSQRSKATLGVGEGTEPKLDNNFMTEVPRTRRLSTFDDEAQRWVRSERGITQDRKHDVIAIEEHGLLMAYRLWQGKRHQGVAEFLTQVLTKREGYEVKLLFSGNEYLFIQEALTYNVRMVSRVYVGDRTWAIFKYNSEGVGWIDWVSEERLA